MGYGIKKIAVSLTSVEPVHELKGLIRLASSKIQLEETSEASKVVKAEIAKHKNALFFRAKAIKANEVNSNGDYFSDSELIRSAQTFVGVPFYTNHNNQDIENARGKIIWSEWDPKEESIYVIGFVDREAYPHICRGIEEEYMTGVSMGCQVEYSVCSICHNSASTVDEYCPHVKNLKGRKFSGKVKDAKTGEIRVARNEPVYEDNYGIRFIELSGVGDPACQSCRIQGIFDNDKSNQSTMSKAASVANSVFMFKESSLYAKASQQEIDQLNQALQSIEEICKNLISNRKNVEVDFAADLVEILSKLQTFTDELVGAGYGQLQQGGIPGVEGDVEAPPAPMPTDNPMAPVQPVSESAPAPVGTVSGSPQSSLVSAPTMPTPPMKPLASTDLAETTITKMSKDISKLEQMAAKMASSNTEEDDMQRRTPGHASKEIEQVRQGLNESWQEKQALSEYTQQSKPDITAKTDNRGDRMKSEQITERQLDEKSSYHAREGEERNEITEVQLGGSKASQIYQRQDDEKTSTHEKQLEAKRTESVPDQTTQVQLNDSRKNEERDSTTQKQLDPNRTGTEQSSIHEKQLESIWTREAFSRKEVKTAKEHVSDVLNVLAEASISLGVTPAQTQESISSMVDSVRSKNELLDSITDESAVAPRGLDVSARAKYYGEKGIRLASVSSKDVKKAISSGLNVLVASDVKVNPEDVVLVLETLTEDSEQGIKAIATAIDDRIGQEKAESTSPSRRQAFRSALTADTEKAEVVEAESVVEAEAEEVKESVTASNATHIIEASFQEVGLVKGMSKSAAKDRISGFVRGVSSLQNKKLAGITNVNVDGEKIQIAVQWDADGETQEVDLSLPGSDDMDLEPEDQAPEGDATGAALDDLQPPALTPPGQEQTPMPAMASAKGKKTVTAQIPGGGGSPPPGAGGMGGQDASVPEPLPGAAEEGIQSLTAEPPADDAEAPGEKDLQSPPGAICPFCGSDDVDVGGKGMEDGTCNCHNCGAAYSLSVNIEVLNPTDVSFKSEDDIDAEAEELETPESPNLPSMPVAAEVSIDSGVIKKIAELEKTHGNVCPSCGTKEIKTLASKKGIVTYVCPACSTKTSKQMFASVADPAKGMLRVAWSINPTKAITAGCESCKEAALKLMANMKVAKMVKAAQAGKFPMSNCMERIARKHGLNTVATFGPCKGKPLADCVCKELEQFAITSTKKMSKLAEVMMQHDDMDECLKDQMEKGYTKEASAHICGTLKKIYASEADDNIYLLAWADEADLTAEDLRAMNTKRAQMELPEELDEVGIDEEGDIGDPLPEDAGLEGLDEPTDDVLEDTVTVELPKEVAEDIAEQVAVQSDEEMVELGVPEVPEAPEAPEAIGVELEGEPLTAKSKKSTKTAKDKKMNKEAKTPTKVDGIEQDVEAGIPRGKATIGNEGKDNIDVVEIELDIPSNGGKGMAGESADNINVKATLPDIPADHATMGGEKEVQKDMPGINTEIKGTVIANIKSVKKIAKTPDHVEHIESEVEAGIPRGDAKLGNESAENIDKPLAKPGIPRGDAKMGNEGADNIDVPAKELDVPADSQFLGHEQEIQSGMPGLELKEKGTIIAGDNREKHLKKIEQARWKKAVSLAGKLLASASIEDSAFDDVVEVLSRVGLDQMETYASRMFPKKAVQKQASTNHALTQAIVQEASGLDLPEPQDKDASLADLFTIGSKGLDENLRRFDMK